MKSGYVSEFTRFIDQYLLEHPEVVEDQREGWNIFWNRHVDFAEQKQAEEDAVPDDTYGFNWAAQHKPPAHH